MEIILTTGKRHYQLRSVLRQSKKPVIFGPLRMTVRAWMLTHTMSTPPVRRMLMHLSSGHMNLLRGECQVPKFSSQSFYGAGQTYIWLCPKFLVFLFQLRDPPMMLCTRPLLKKRHYSVIDEINLFVRIRQLKAQN